MSAFSAPAAGTRPAPAPARRQPKRPGGAGLGQDHSNQAKRLAAAILEVLAGLRTPAQAAAALGMSLPRYYHCEGQALRGLLAACEARPPGRRRPLDRELAALRQQHQRLERELARQQSLVRLAQRAVGLAPPPAPGKAPGRKRSRRPMTRALHIADRLQQDSAAAPTAAEATTT